MTRSQTKQQRRAARERQRKIRTWLTWGGIAAAVLVLIAVLLLTDALPAAAMGDEIVITTRQHVEEGTDPGPYETNLPSGGRHYPATFRAGFYEEGDPETQRLHPEGYLVHNLEHGYVVFWYNCAADPNLDCEQLKDTIRSVMEINDGLKLIAFPWSDQPEPLVMTSWGRIMRFDEVDPDTMRAFVRGNLNKAPESYAD